MDVERNAFIEAAAGVALIAGLSIGLQVFAVDGFSQNARASSFTYTTWSAKKKCMCQLTILNCILKRCSDVLLPYHRTERLGAILTCRYDKLLHNPYAS